MGWILIALWFLGTSYPIDASQSPVFTNLSSQQKMLLSTVFQRLGAGMFAGAEIIGVKGDELSITGFANTGKIPTIQVGEHRLQNIDALSVPMAHELGHCHLQHIDREQKLIDALNKLGAQQKNATPAQKAVFKQFVASTRAAFVRQCEGEADQFAANLITKRFRPSQAAKAFEEATKALNARTIIPDMMYIKKTPSGQWLFGPQTMFSYPTAYGPKYLTHPLTQKRAEMFEKFRQEALKKK